MGGAVRGNRLYGKFPTLAVNARTTPKTAVGYRQQAWMSFPRPSRDGLAFQTLICRRFSNIGPVCPSESWFPRLTRVIWERARLGRGFWRPAKTSL